MYLMRSYLGFEKQMSTRYHGFLVGKCQLRARSQRHYRRLQSHRSVDAVEHDVRAATGELRCGLFPRQNLCFPNMQLIKAPLERGNGGRIFHSHAWDIESGYLPCQQLNPAAICGETDHAKTMRMTGYEFQRLSAYRTA
jgi:hypothetical protein